MSDPGLDEDARQTLVNRLMTARRDVKHFKEDPIKLKKARAKVYAAKVALGERGPVWWTDASPDENRKLVKNSSYNEWWIKEAQTSSTD